MKNEPAIQGYEGRGPSFAWSGVATLLVAVVMPMSVASCASSPFLVAQVPSLTKPVVVLHNQGECMAAVVFTNGQDTHEHLVAPQDELRVPLPQGRWLISWKCGAESGNVHQEFTPGRVYHLFLGARKKP